jgi:hypothetical protein
MAESRLAKFVSQIWRGGTVAKLRSTYYCSTINRLQKNTKANQRLIAWLLKLTPTRLLAKYYAI